MEASSPAALAGLQPHSDYIVGADQLLQDVRYHLFGYKCDLLTHLEDELRLIQSCWFAVGRLLLTDRGPWREAAEAAGVQHTNRRLQGGDGHTKWSMGWRGQVCVVMKGYLPKQHAIRLNAQANISIASNGRCVWAESWLKLTHNIHALSV